MTPLEEVAANAHELFTTLTAQGFSEHQALYLTAQIVTAGIKGTGA